MDRRVTTEARPDRESDDPSALAVASRLGSTGLRVLVAATALVDRTPAVPDHGGRAALPGLTLTSVAGIADPPRPQARDAVALCRTAGVAVKMITGDHADTAAAIARELDIVGEVVTGAELDRMTADQLAERPAPRTGPGGADQQVAGAGASRPGPAALRPARTAARPRRGGA